ncbi:MAG: TlpA family protein disulfide reductase [Tannerella sp.]|nr:TlpA family protein disulfide reductase [Tannerella sp.]
MKKTSLLICLLLSATTARYAAAQGNDSHGGEVAIGDAMPAFVITADDGTQTTSAQFRGKVVLVNFFATWCPPCRTELAEMEKKLWPEYKDREDFVLLVIGREHSGAEVEKYGAERGLSFPLYPDKDRKIFAAFARQLIPRSYLTDKQGKIIFIAKGYEKKEFDNLMKAIERALLQ